jgi:isopenicillin N synthase-like dioxygenase
MTACQTGDFGSIPIVDIRPMFDTKDQGGALQVAQEIRKAAIEVGFFYISNHNIPADLMRAVYMCSKYFFQPPEEIKKSITINDAHRGYVAFKQTVLEGARIADLKESFNFAFPFTPDHPEVLAGKPLVGMNQWLPNEQTWRAILESYYQHVFELGQRVLEAIALSLDLKRDFFRALYKNPLVRARLLHYPPQPADAHTNQYGAAPHTDFGTITILWQDDVGGLQVRNRGGDWVDAPYIEGTFVVNIGDMLARWSNDLFVSTPHRVVNASGQERFSIPVFYDPDFDTEVACLPNCASPDNPAKYEPIIAGKYITAKYDASYAYRQKQAT